MTYIENPNKSGKVVSHSINFGGFTLIELMIVVAIIAIILTLALPVYSNYTIRTKIGEGLSVAAAAKTAVAATCLEDPLLTNLNNDAAGYSYDASTWVASINVSGNCDEPIITIATQNTGAQPSPEVLLTGTISDDPGVITWICSSSSENYLLPKECRS